MKEAAKYLAAPLLPSYNLSFVKVLFCTFNSSSFVPGSLLFSFLFRSIYLLHMFSSVSLESFVPFPTILTPSKARWVSATALLPSAADGGLAFKSAI